jgi:hypothetical protein
MTESSRLRFDLYSWGTLTVLLVGTGVYFAFHLAWNLILLGFLLVCIWRHLRCGRVLPNLADTDPDESPQQRTGRGVPPMVPAVSG